MPDVRVVAAVAAATAALLLPRAEPSFPAATPPPAQEGAPLPAAARDDAAAEQLGWRLGTQAWTFRDRTAFEVIDTAKRLGLRYVEFFPGQSLAPEQRDVKVGPDMGAERLKEFRAKLDAQGVKAVSFGVTGFSNDEASARRTFEFARALGLETITTEPDFDALDLVARLAAEHSIRLALHNHPEPSPYWNPDVVLRSIAGREKAIGACADTGHWTRSGLKPVDCLKKLEGHVIELHFKDLNAFGDKGAIDIPWGTGVSDARGILRELHRQRFRGLISIEYEHGAGAELERNVAKCIAFFDETARALAAGPR